jgi:hypothetical protein
MGAEFESRYSRTGRPSIPPERVLRALLLQVLYSIRSERQPVEQLDYNLLFRWFVGLGLVDTVWERGIFCDNRDRLFEEALLREFFDRVLELAVQAHLSLEKARVGRDCSASVIMAPQLSEWSAAHALLLGTRLPFAPATFVAIGRRCYLPAKAKSVAAPGSSL